MTKRHTTRKTADRFSDATRFVWGKRDAEIAGGRLPLFFTANGITLATHFDPAYASGYRAGMAAVGNLRTEAN
jgi:hypothetical protein